MGNSLKIGSCCILLLFYILIKFGESMSSIFCRWSGSRLRFLFYLLLLTLAIATVSCSFGPSSGSNTQSTPTHAGPVNTSKPSGLIQAHGANLVDATGHPVVLRGADLESPFIYIKGWNQG